MVKVMLTLLVVVTVATLTGTLGGAGPTTEESYEWYSVCLPLTVTVVLAMVTVLSWAATVTVALHW